MNPDKVALYDVLLERLQDHTLTPEGREWLARLREEADTSCFARHTPMPC